MVFQAELHAIRMAVPYIKETGPYGSSANIMCDSQAAIKALQEIDTSSITVNRTKLALDRLGEDYDICIHWINAHVNHKGNEMADVLAKTGCALRVNEATPVSRAYVKSIITDRMYEEWNRRLQTQGDRRQTFQFDWTKSKAISKLSRADLGIMIR